MWGVPPAQDNRLTLEGILWIARTGAPWRDLPAEFGKGNTVYQRFRRWTKAGVFDALFNRLAGEFNLGAVTVDGTFIDAFSRRPFGTTGQSKSGRRSMMSIVFTLSATTRWTRSRM